MVDDFRRRNPHSYLRSTSNREAGHIEALRKKERAEVDTRLKKAGIDSSTSVTETPVSRVRQSSPSPKPADWTDSQPWNDEPPSRPREVSKKSVSEAVDLKYRIKDLQTSLKMDANAREAGEFYEEVLEQMDTLISALSEAPEDATLLDHLHALEEKYGPPPRLTS